MPSNPRTSHKIEEKLKSDGILSETSLTKTTFKKTTFYFHVFAILSLIQIIMRLEMVNFTIL